MLLRYPAVEIHYCRSRVSVFGPCW